MIIPLPVLLLNVNPEDIESISVNVKGTKEIVDIKINEENIDDIEMLQDMLVVAINNAMKEIDKETEAKMGKYTQGMPGLF